MKVGSEIGIAVVNSLDESAQVNLRNRMVRFMPTALEKRKRKMVFAMIINKTDDYTDTLTPRAVLKALWHFAHWIRPGAVRIGVTRYTDQLDVTAFHNPDGGVALVLLNKAEQALPVQLRVEDQLVSFVLPPRSLTSGLMQ